MKLTVDQYKRALPHVLVMLWVVFLAATIWQHALASVQPPSGDGLSYLQKAASFWAAVEQGKPFNPLNLFPSLRPPGSILMSYPFGLTVDFHGYHFRSVFLPLLCVVLAVYIAAGPANAQRDGWSVAGIALLFSSLPMFFWLDWNDARRVTNGWGMVDNFQAGIAALAGAAMVRSVYTRSQAWLFAASCLACLTFLVKQSGLMIMGVLALVWLIVLILEWRLVFRSNPGPLRTYAIKGVVQLFVIYAAVLVPSIFSGYFSRSNFAYAMKALGFYRDVAPSPGLGLFHQASGEIAVLWMLGVVALFIFRLPNAVDGNRLVACRALGLLVGSVVIWLLGIWYWIVIQAGGSQIRYFHPFMLMGAICAVPAAMFAWPRSSRWLRWPLLALCFASALNIALLLVAGDSPSLEWQKLSGVSVSVGHHRDEVAQANALLAEIRTGKADARVYFTPMSSQPQTFIFVGAYEKIVKPALPAFIPVSPMDWSRGFVVRIYELLDSDYIVTRKLEGHEPEGRFAAKEFNSFRAEFNAFDGWLSTLDRRSGVEIFSESETLRVLRVIDRDALLLALHKFVSEHTWRPEFHAANRAPPPAWSGPSLLTAGTRTLAAQDVDFENVYMIHGLAVHEIDQGITIDMWWEELRHEEANDKRYFFLHLVDATGAILYSQHIALFPYNPPAPDRRWRYGSSTFVDVLPNAEITALAFGIYQPGRPDGGLMLSNGTRTDWGGKRNLVAITPAQAATNPRPQ